MSAGRPSVAAAIVSPATAKSTHRACHSKVASQVLWVSGSSQWEAVTDDNLLDPCGDGALDRDVRVLPTAAWYVPVSCQVCRGLIDLIASKLR